MIKVDIYQSFWVRVSALETYFGLFPLFRTDSSEHNCNAPGSTNLVTGTTLFTIPAKVVTGVFARKQINSAIVVVSGLLIF